MVKKTHNGLGKGLDALLKDVKITDDTSIRQIAVSRIVPNPFQPRMDFADAAIEELAQSIKKHGVLQPILVRKRENIYQIIAGERRWRACKKNNMAEIPAILCDYNDSETAQIALIENLQRENLNAIEEAAAYGQLIKETGIKQSEIAQYVGKSRSHVANFLRLLQLPEMVQQFIKEGALNMGQAKPLLSLNTEKLQIKAAVYIIAKSLSARNVEMLVKKLLNNPEYLSQKLVNNIQAKDVFINDTEDKLTAFLGTKVNIRKGKKKSKIEIEFTSVEELNQIIETLLPVEKKYIQEKNNGDFFV
ncbi:ParB/RepB/Spo0J family partition protein [Pectinatus frisingensis]|jgi:ParB family chromosome partitioning protein|uniref:ParB/RepB/Spo0J family partition protein n=1 Tax=Pectinatus frisingensis TaxID=865 RepID=UPI0015F694CB|nr:ParB/RepB/Spo0J family partition protein [Pectinatus frisingensis]